MNIDRPVSKQPIPPNAKMVFKGKLFDVYQWEQELYDGTKAIFEKIKRPDTVLVFPILEDGKILLAEQEQPGRNISFIGAIGGRVDDGEAPLAAVKRELLEESGYEAEEFVLWHAVQPVLKIDWAIYVFVAKGLKKVSDLNLDGGEKIKLLPLTFEELVESTSKVAISDESVLIKILEARLDPEKMAELRRLFSI